MVQSLALLAEGPQEARARSLANERSSLQNLLLQNQIDTAPAREDRAERALSLQEGVRQRQAEAAAAKALSEASEAERMDGLRTAAQFAAIKDQAGLEAFAASNPIDARESGLLGSRFGDEAFQRAAVQADLLLRAGERLGEVETNAPLSPVGKIQADINAGRITPEQGQAAITKATTSQPLVNVNTGEIPTGKKVADSLKGDLVGIRASIDRINNISRTFDPSFLNVGTRFDNARTALKDKFSGTVFANFLGEATEEERRALSEFSLFKQSALANLNEEIKRITGAALSEAEATRIRASLPDPGESIFDGDSPTEFEAKLKGVIRDLNRAMARTTFALQNGLGEFDIPLDGIDAIIDRRDAELAAQGLSVEERDAILKQEFGL